MAALLAAILALERVRRRFSNVSRLISGHRGTLMKCYRRSGHRGTLMKCYRRPRETCRSRLQR